MNQESQNNKLNAKDLINVGIFTAIYFALYFVTMMLGYIPVFTILLGILTPIVCGIPFMLYVTKINKFGMVSLTGIIIGILFMVMGSGTLVLVCCVICGILADVVMRAGKYKDIKFIILGYSFFSLLSSGFFARIYFMRSEFLKTVSEGYGAEYAKTLAELTPNWVLPVFVLSCFVGGILGGILGRAVLNKHFKKAGIV